MSMKDPGLKVNNQLAAYATKFLAVRLKKSCVVTPPRLKSQSTVQGSSKCNFSSACSPDHNNILRLIDIDLNIDIPKPGTK